MSKSRFTRSFGSLTEFADQFGKDYVAAATTEPMHRVHAVSVERDPMMVVNAVLSVQAEAKRQAKAEARAVRRAAAKAKRS